jgi:hypothetical protein
MGHCNPSSLSETLRIISKECPHLSHRYSYIGMQPSDIYFSFFCRSSTLQRLDSQVLMPSLGKTQILRKTQAPIMERMKINLTTASYPRCCFVPYNIRVRPLFFKGNPSEFPEFSKQILHNELTCLGNRVLRGIRTRFLGQVGAV